MALEFTTISVVNEDRDSITYKLEYKDGDTVGSVNGSFPKGTEINVVADRMKSVASRAAETKRNAPTPTPMENT